jgi:hypothetical protein
MSDLNILPKDQNYIRAAGFESSSTPGLVMAGQIDEVTGRILVDSAGGGGTGTVTSVSVVTANGLYGTVATATTTPAITLGTSVTGILKGNGTAISVATAGTDYLTPTGSAAGLTSFPTLNQNTTGSAATLTTTRTIWGQNFNGSANVTGTLALGASDLTLTGSIGATGARATKVWTAALESTAMPTVGGVAILTSLTAPQFTTIELGAASDTTLSRVSAGVIAVEGVTIPSISSTNTLTNKRVTKRISAVGSSATPTINTDNVDIFQITSLAVAITSMSTNLSGTPVAGDMMMIQITDNGSARAITWGASFASTTVTLPTTTVASTMLRVGFQRNNANTVWDCIAVA